jgi:exopolysaccharide production protein ExoY
MTTHYKDLHAVAPTNMAVFRRVSHQGAYGLLFKRVLDIAFVVAVAPIALPLILVAALLVATDGHAPFYMQKRVGRFGGVFGMVKLRSMVLGADEVLAEYLGRNPEANAEWNLSQKLRKDPRITKVGRFLRKSSLDELPQLWNVLVGDMSVVGPRPITEAQRGLYPGRSYYMLQPGITGLWQVSKRNDCSFKDRSIIDDQYAETLSFREDLRIVVRTVGVVIRCTGL